ncbi:MAG: hypothetical protein ACK4NN_17290, partial [Rheinheimera sp.]
MKLSASMLSWVMIVSLPLQLFAHNGDDHGDDEKSVQPVALSATGSRAYASSELFELVLVAPAAAPSEHSPSVTAQSANDAGTAQQLTIYLDYFADNSPVADAVIDVDANGFSGKASMLQPGVYQLAVPALQSQRYAISFTIEAGDELDLLSTELDLTTTQQELPHE